MPDLFFSGFFLNIWISTKSSQVKKKVIYTQCSVPSLRVIQVGEKRSSDAFQAQSTPGQRQHVRDNTRRESEAVCVPALPSAMKLNLVSLTAQT